MDSISFNSFSGIGVSTSDTFDIWRKKTNGITAQLQTITNEVNSLYSGDAINFVTLNGTQSITGAKTFGAGSINDPLLKIGNAGLYFDSNILKSSAPVQASSIIATSFLGLGSTVYNVPSGNVPTSPAFLMGNSGVLSWKDETTLINSVAISAGKLGVLNQSVPVGTIIAYSGLTIPTGWLECDGASYNTSTYSALAAILGTTYGVDGKLPDLKGRSIIGRGTGTDDITTQDFVAGSHGGLYKHSLITDEMPRHIHSLSGLTIGAGGAHTHTYLYSGDQDARIVKFFGGHDGYGSSPRETSRIEDHTHTITGGTIGETGSNTPFSILQPYLSTIYIIKALPDVIVNTQISAGDGIKFTKLSDSSNTTSFNLSASDTYTVAIKHDSTLIISANGLGIANSSITNAEIVTEAISPDKIKPINGGSISWDGSNAYYTNESGTSPLLTSYTANLNGPVKQLREKTHGDTSAMSWQEYAYINHDENVVVTGKNRNSIFGACNAFGHQIMPLPLNRKASKLYISEYSMVCLDTDGKIWAIGRNSYNQFNLTSGSTSDLTTWTQAFPQITNVIKKVVLSACNTYVLDTSDNLWSAGFNGYGQLGNGTNINTSDVVSPVTGYQNTACNPTVSSIYQFISDIVICGSDLLITACIFSSTNNKIYTTGFGANGQIGNSFAVSKNVWTSIGSNVNWSDYKLYGKGNSTFGGFFAVNSDGSLAYAWGYNGDNTFGVPTNSPIMSLPLKIWDGSNGNISKLYTSHTSGVTYILTIAKLIYVTGNNSSGNFGDSTINSSTSWKSISTPAGYVVSDLYVSNSDSTYCSAVIKCTKDNNSFLFGTGSNFNGQLGNAGVSLVVSNWTPILISSDIVTNIKDVQLGYNSTNNSAYSLLSLNDGKLYWAGYNDFNFDSGIEPSWNNNQYRTIFNRVK